MVLRTSALLVTLLAISIGVVAAAAPAAPRTQAGSATSTRWTLDFKPGALRLFVDPISRKPYWYMDYRVINRTGQDRMWAPQFELFTDDGSVKASGKEVPTRVVKALKEVLGNPLIEDQNQIIGELLQGVENAKDGLVIWPAKNLQVTEISLFVRGLSGETTKVLNPQTGEEVVLWKTLHRVYMVPGDPLPRGGQPLPVVKDDWVMR
ncbi:MAG: hypothetical protein KDA22_10110 [Phycisphaerales bacterium]|nr:hypothetical protein [Phycisphaerales bacterium]